LAALGFGSVVLQGGLAGKASRLVGERSTMTMGLLLLAFGLFGLGIAHAIAAVSASLTALVIGIGLATPALNALLAEQGGEHEHGAVMGLSQSASALGRVVGPLCASGAIEVFGIGAPFLAGALTCVAAFLVAIHVQTTHAGGSWKASRLWSLHTRRT
jgi:MFS family permease